jgi:hypothetical protein
LIGFSNISREKLLLRQSTVNSKIIKKILYKNDFSKTLYTLFRLIGFDQDSAGEDDDSRDGFEHGLIKYIDAKAKCPKCRHLKKLPVKGLCGSVCQSL